MTDTTGSAPAGNPAGTAAGTEGAPAGTAATTTAAAADSWTAAITNPDLKGFAELKGFKTPEAAVEAYRNLEKFQGLPPERLAKIPEADDAAGQAEFNKRFGWAAPDKPEDYALPVPQGIEPDFAQAVAAKFHQIGVPKDMAIKITEAVNAISLQKMTDFDKAVELQHANDLVQLKQEWGANHDQLQELSRRAAAEFMPKAGLVDADMEAIRDAIGSAKFAKLWAGIGGSLGEAKFVDSGSPHTSGALMTPDAARTRLTQLGQDKEWFARYEKGGVREQTEYKQLKSIVANATLAAH